jgi:hypothetical protein
LDRSAVLLAKPFTPQELARKIRWVLEKDIPPIPAISG